MQSSSGQVYLLAVVALGVVIVLAGTTLAAQSSSSNTGTWKINFAKSRTLSADKGPTSVSTAITNEAAGAGMRCTVEVVSVVDGTLRHWEFSGNYDGKDNAIKGNSQYGDVVALTRADANTTRSVYKNRGEVTVTLIMVVSSDGKTMTISSTGTDAQGNPVNSVAVYDKQSR